MDTTLQEYAAQVLSRGDQGVTCGGDMQVRTGRGIQVEIGKEDTVSMRLDVISPGYTLLFKRTKFRALQYYFEGPICFTIILEFHFKSQICFTIIS